MRAFFLILSFLVLFLNLLASAALSPAEIEKAKQDLSSADPLVRRAAVRFLSDGISHTLPPGRPIVKGFSGDELLPLLFPALLDRDAEVRANSAAALSMIAILTKRATHPRSPDNPDITTYPEAAKALTAAMDDENEIVRTNALSAYALTFGATNDLKSKWMKQFSSESSKGIKDQILGLLLLGPPPSERVILFLVEQMKTPAFQYSAAKSLLQLSPPPPQALPVLVEKLKKNDLDTGAREVWVRLIGAYGTAAQAHLPMLRELESKESNRIVKRNLHSAIEKIAADTAPK